MEVAPAQGIEVLQINTNIIAKANRINAVSGVRESSKKRMV